MLLLSLVVVVVVVVAGVVDVAVIGSIVIVAVVVAMVGVVCCFVFVEVNLIQLSCGLNKYMSMQETNMSYLGKRKFITACALGGCMLVTSYRLPVEYYTYLFCFVG